VVCAWIGNSQAVARKHYLQVTEEHFERAYEPATKTPTPVHADTRRVSPSNLADAIENEDGLVLAGAGECPHNGLLGDQGLEQPAFPTK